MPDFDFEDMKKPFKNKKVAPFLIAGIALIVLYVLFKAISSKSSTATYSTVQPTYATNDGTTTQVSNMLEEYKSGQDDKLEQGLDYMADALEANQEQTAQTLAQALAQLEAMQEQQSATLDANYQANMEALDEILSGMMDRQGSLTTTVNQLIAMGGATYDPATGALVDKNGNALTQGGQNLLNGGLSNYEAAGGSNQWLEKWRADLAATPIPVDGEQLINNWAHYAARDDSGTGSSYSDLTGRDTNYYYGESTSPITTIESQHSSSGFTGYDGSTVSSGVTETIITREDGTRVISYTPNADHWTRQ